MDPPSRGRLLVVDDEKDILDSVKAYLQAALPAEVLIARSGDDALKILKSDPHVDVILSDYRMPGMDGLRFLRLASELAPDVPRALMTAFPDMQLAIDALNRASIAQFLTKPVEPERLLAVCADLLAKSRRSRSRDAALKRAGDTARGNPPRQ